MDPIQLLAGRPSVLGSPWHAVYKTRAQFGASHFEVAMSRLIREPNINSTVIMRADILELRTDAGSASHRPHLPVAVQDAAGEQQQALARDLDDVQIRKVPLAESRVVLRHHAAYVRRIIPRNPYKDHIINQTCALLKGTNAMLVVYIPHIGGADEVPYYLPPVHAVGLLYHAGELSIHYVPFEDQAFFSDPSSRPLRIALRLLQTLAKHLAGVRKGYEKRVNHDLVVSRVAFQNRYIELKKKYSAGLVAAWVEKTDPKKHVFEDLALAAFLIELWTQRYPKGDVEFRDLGCGNGLLVHILILEGFRGKGIDARARKLWKTYPAHVQEHLLEQVVVPSVLLRPHPAVAQMAPGAEDNGRIFSANETHYTAQDLLRLPKVCTTEEFPEGTFVIGNHLDELTCWIPLLNFDFLVLPCCSHALNGHRVRFNPRPFEKQTSTYRALVDHVEDLAVAMGWAVEKEILRIPSTRNAAVLGTRKVPPFDAEPRESYLFRLHDIVLRDGGAEGWVENTMALMTQLPKSH